MAKAHATTKTTKPAAMAKAGSAADADDVAVASGSQAGYDAFMPAARRLGAAEVVPMRADPQLALHNVQIGVASVLAEGTRVSKLHETDVNALASLPRIALAVVYASTQIVPVGGQVGLAQWVARAAVLRALLLKTADALVLADLFPKAEVDKIRAGHGKLDAARDLVALVSLFAKRGAKVRGKHPVTAAQLKEASELGTGLLKILKPGRARRTPNEPAVGTDERDRLWTLLVQGHDRLWRAGAYLFGRNAVDTMVPSLLANRAGRPKKAPAPPQTPAAPVARPGN